MKLKQIGSNIKIARLNLGYTQTEVAKKMKVSRMTISRYETGSSEIPIKQLEKLSIFLKTPLVNLLTSTQSLTDNKELLVPKNKYVIKVEEYKTKCPRINGFSKPAKLGLSVPSPMRVVKDSAFRYYLKHRQLPNLLIKEIKEYFKQAREQNPNRGVYIGRGYYVPRLESPPGPRTGGIYDIKEYLESIKNFYNYAIDNEYHVKGSNIAVVLHPFIHPYLPPLQENPEIAYPGGAVVPVRNSSDTIIIEAIWGHDEAIQTLPHDEFVVNFNKKIIVEKKIQSKNTALKAGKHSKYKEIPVAPSHKTIQTLNDQQILQIAEDYKKIFEKFGNHRIEFILQPEGVVYRECTPFTYEQKSETVRTDAKGKVHVIKTQQDIDELKQTVEIVSIHPDVIKKRNMDILTTLALKKGNRLFVLYPGSTTTAHSATIFREQGHTLVYVKNRIFKNKDLVEISIKNGELVATIANQKNSSKLISSNLFKKTDQNRMGMKALRLFEINEHNIQIPKTTVINTEVFENFIQVNSIDLLVQKLDQTNNHKKILSICQKIQKSIMDTPVSENITQQIKKQASSIKKKQLSIRSSANCEDSNKASFAGQFSSFLNINSHDVVRYVKAVWASIYNSNAILYAKKIGFLPSNLSMAVILQEMIKAKKAGVIFTENINNGKNSEMIIEATNGLGDKIVDGVIKPERIIVDKSNNNFIIANRPKNKRILSKEEIKRIANISQKIEKLYHCGQDIEWAIDTKGQFFILQTRPITTS